MAYRSSLNSKDHSVAALFTLGVVLVAANLLIMELQYREISWLRTPETVISLAVPLPAPPPVEPAKRQPEQEAGRASPENIHSKATPIEAPKPIIPPPKPPEITAAPKANSGADSQSGAAAIAGVGSGAGGTGDGSGAGGSGRGTGGGGARPIWQSGAITEADYPSRSSSAHRGGEVEVRFTILPTGRVTACRTAKSSGDMDLDGMTCRLIEQRFRFRPATNAMGEPIASQYGWRQSYWLERRR